MSILRIFFGSIACFFLLLNPAGAVSNQQLSYKNYWHPFFLGERLDHCNLGHTLCGKPIANRYCKLMGYDYANQQVIANNVGLTNHISSRARCTGWQCNGFMTIECAKIIRHIPAKAFYYRKIRFPYPRYNHYRVDWCYKDCKGCGKRAAYSFCRRMGYMNTVGYAIDKKVYASQTIGSQKLCFGPQCNGFRYITCYR